MQFIVQTGGIVSPENKHLRGGFEHPAVLFAARVEFSKNAVE